MADVQNIITLGIGSAPGSIKFFVLTGLDVSGPSIGTSSMTLYRRGISPTLSTRVITTGTPERTITIELDEDR